MKHRIFLVAFALVLVAGFARAEKKAPAPRRAPEAAPAPVSKLYQKASKHVLPKVDFKESTVREALDFLLQRVRAVDAEGKGDTVNVLVKGDGSRVSAFQLAPEGVATIPGLPPPPGNIPGLDVPGVPAAPPAAPLVTKKVAEGTEEKITLTLNNVPLSEVVKYVANVAGYRVRWDEHAVVFIVPKPGQAVPPKEERRPELKVGPGVPKRVTEKLNQIIFPKVDFREATPREAFDFLLTRARSLDPDGAGVSMVLKFDGMEEMPLLTMTMNNLSMLEVLRYVAEFSGMEITIDRFAIVIAPPQKP